jgi:twitching motility protein PilT
VVPAEQQGMIVPQLASALRGIIAQRLVPTLGRGERVMACEILNVNAGVSACIREHRFEQIPNIIQTSKKERMQTMDDSLCGLYLQGVISYDTCLTNASNVVGVRDRLHRKKDAE